MYAKQKPITICVSRPSEKHEGRKRRVAWDGGDMTTAGGKWPNNGLIQKKKHLTLLESMDILTT